MIADMATEIHASRLMTWNSAVLLDQGKRNTLETSHAKRFAADTAMKVTTDAVQVYGGYGFIKEYPVEKLMRDAKIMQLYEGTSQIQRLVIARETLLPAPHRGAGTSSPTAHSRSPDGRHRRPLRQTGAPWASVEARIAVPDRSAPLRRSGTTPTRWPSFVDGFGRDQVDEGDWPKQGARSSGTRRPGDRGRVIETVDALRGRARSRSSRSRTRSCSGTSDRARSTAIDGGATWSSLDARLRAQGRRPADEGDRPPLHPPRRMRDSLHRTLRRFALRAARRPRADALRATAR